MRSVALFLMKPWQAVEVDKKRYGWTAMVFEVLFVFCFGFGVCDLLVWCLGFVWFLLVWVWFFKWIA